MNPPKKLASQQRTDEEQLSARLGQTQQAAFREFASVEEMLRHDAVHTPVPPSIAHRLRESLGPLPPPSRSWWRRLFGG
ncbi:MAG TPA: hypothetical protein VN578_22685 [Candidatus Binatia bacterium]|jgi:hypothetical protein|nr:hypothetical protein [Candidatus Binatia bacterium]